MGSGRLSSNDMQICLKMQLRRSCGRLSRRTWVSSLRTNVTEEGSNVANPAADAYFGKKFQRKGREGRGNEAHDGQSGWEFGRTFIFSY